MERHSIDMNDMSVEDLIAFLEECAQAHKSWANYSTIITSSRRIKSRQLQHNYLLRSIGLLYNRHISIGMCRRDRCPFASVLEEK